MTSGVMKAIKGTFLTRTSPCNKKHSITRWVTVYHVGPYCTSVQVLALVESNEFRSMTVSLHMV
jgi:hypothetical protein